MLPFIIQWILQQHSVLVQTSFIVSETTIMGIVYFDILGNCPSKRKRNLMRFAKNMVHLPYLGATAGAKICFESV